MWRIIVFTFMLLQYASAGSEEGKFTVELTSKKNIAVFSKSMFNGTSVGVKVHCSSPDFVMVKVTWLLRWTPCAQEFSDINEPETSNAENYFMNPDVIHPDIPFDEVKYIGPLQSEDIMCIDGTNIDIPVALPSDYHFQKGRKVGFAVVTKEPAARSQDEPTSRKKRQANDPNKQVVSETSENAEQDTKEKTETKREDEESKATVPDNEDTTGSSYQGTTEDLEWTTFNPEDTFGFMFDRENQGSASTDVVGSTWEDGVYLFMLRVDLVDPNSEKDFLADVTVDMKGPHGYISAIEWPLLPFYGVMCVIYVIFGLIWLVLSACNWRDLLRIQFWIGGVIFLGMLEKAVFFSEQESIEATGKSVKGALMFGEVVSCLKRTLARMLVIIVSLGFGIVKPRLGPVLHKVLALGGLYFILSAVEGCLRVYKPRSDQSTQGFVAAIPLAVLDAAICWWIFTGLVNTIRTLRLRRNLVKLTLFRHFTNTLIFAVVASIAFMIWSITQHKFTKCLTDWRELWVDEAFWHLLFSIILMVIMVLWRPSANNQRYAFSPLMDSADDEAGEPMMNEAYDGMKMRGTKNGSPIRDKSKADDDLKWIDEHIPSAVADIALPSLLDSDEELQNTKYEMSKME